MLIWGIQLGADFKYLIEQKSYGVEMVRLFAQMVRLLHFLEYNISSGPFLSYEIEIGDGPGPELDNHI